MSIEFLHAQHFIAARGLVKGKGAVLTLRFCRFKHIHLDDLARLVFVFLSFLVSSFLLCSSIPWVTRFASLCLI